jgi:hypothetical protein
MAKKDRPWWSKNHTLWGGETFASTQSKPRLGIRSGDKFRVEKGLKNNITLSLTPTMTERGRILTASRTRSG